MTTTPSSQFFVLRTRLAGAQLGVDRSELIKRAAREKVMQSEEAAPFHRELCKIAVAAFESAGEPNSASAILFKNLSQSRDWPSSYNRFTDSVRRALSKNASVLLPAVAATHDKLGGGLMKTLTAGGALGGAALGSLAFLMMRNANQSSSQNAELLEKIRAYRKLKRDIEEDLASNDTMKVEEPERRFHV